MGERAGAGSTHVDLFNHNQRLIELEIPKGVFLNVNFPKIPAAEVKGVKVTSQGRLRRERPGGHP